METVDAAGNMPKKLNSYERQWRDTVESGELQKRYEKLQERMNLSLKDKIELSSERIREWYYAFDGNVSVSNSGGKDSAVLLFLVRRLFPDVQSVFCNTGLEYPEILAMIKKTSNSVVMRPRKPFHYVIRDHGWPVVSKKVARGLDILRNPTGCNQNIRRLYEEGINRFGEKVNGFKVSDRWRFLIHAPFSISDKCCEVMKKEPMHRYEKQSGNVQYVGIMASDSKQRQKTYLQTGCNAFDMKRPRSAPLSFWTEQDILQCLKMYDIPYAKVYGKIIQKNDGNLVFTGVHSTGCVYCCFGLHMEDNPTRFQKMYTSHPKLWKYCMKKLGLEQILYYIWEHCPDRNIISKFRVYPDKNYVQRSLFDESEI